MHFLLKNEPGELSWEGHISMSCSSQDALSGRKKSAGVHLGMCECVCHLLCLVPLPYFSEVGEMITLKTGELCTQSGSHGSF